MSANLVGFDIGDSAVKIVQASDGMIKKAVSADVLDNMVSQGNILSMDAMADFIKENAKRGGISGGNAAVILPERLVVTRMITMPVMTESQLKYNLPYEFGDYLEDEKTKYFYDYALKSIEEDEEGNPKEMNLLACAVAKETIAEYRQMFRRAGFRMKVAVPAIYAYGKYIEKTEGFNFDKYYCLVNIGHSSTTLFFYHGNEIVSSRAIDFGIESFEKMYADAEEIDIHIAHAHAASNYENILEGELANAFYNNLAVEVMKAVNFFNYNNREADLSELILFGGGALIPDLLTTLQNVTELSIRKAGEVSGSLVAGTPEPELYIQALASTL